jgi:hypothetical protein
VALEMLPIITKVICIKLEKRCRGSRKRNGKSANLEGKNRHG